LRGGFVFFLEEINGKIKVEGGEMMNISSIMAKQVSELQHTLNLSLLKGQMATQAAQATVMLEDFAKTQQSVQAPHPTLGKQIDIRV
jgi:hypothetical protein